MKKIRNDIKKYKYTKGFTLIEIIFGIAITATTATAIYLVGNHVNQTNKSDNEIKFLTQTLNDIDLMTTVSNSYQGFNKEQLSSVRKNTNSAFGVNDITVITPQQISINYNNIPSGSCLSIVNSMVKLTDTSAKVNGVTIPNNSNNKIISPACAANNLNTVSIIRNKSMVGATASVAADAPTLTPPPSISTPAVVSPSSNTPTSYNTPVGINIPNQVAVLNPSNNNPNQTTLTPIPTSLPVVPKPAPSPAPVTPVPSPTPISGPVTPIVAPEMNIPSLEENGISATIKLETYNNGTWTITRLNCGNSPYADMSVACKYSYINGNFFPQGNAGDYEISRSNHVTTVPNYPRLTNTTMDPVCMSWLNITSQSSGCFQIVTGLIYDPFDTNGNFYLIGMNDVFTINIRNRKNPSQVWSQTIRFSASIPQHYGE